MLFTRAGPTLSARAQATLAPSSPSELGAFFLVFGWNQPYSGACLARPAKSVRTPKRLLRTLDDTRVAAVVWGVSVSTVRRWRKAKAIPQARLEALRLEARGVAKGEAVYRGSPSPKIMSRSTGRSDIREAAVAVGGRVIDSTSAILIVNALAGAKWPKRADTFQWLLQCRSLDVSRPLGTRAYYTRGRYNTADIIELDKIGRKKKPKWYSFDLPSCAFGRLDACLYIGLGKKADEIGYSLFHRLKTLSDDIQVLKVLVRTIDRKQNS